MLTKRQKRFYGKQLAAKLSAIGVEDRIQMRLVKVYDVKNPEYDPENATGPKDPKAKEFFQVPVFQAANVYRSTIKRLLKSTDVAIKAFLGADVSVLKDIQDRLDGKAVAEAPVPELSIDQLTDDLQDGQAEV
jgi:hypothetical protein